MTAGELGNDDLSSASTSFTELPTAWYRDQIKGYYKNNLSIGHLNVNSILGKIDEVLDLLNECRFDILFLSETKLDKFVSLTLLSNPVSIASHAETESEVLVIRLFTFVIQLLLDDSLKWNRKISNRFA